MFACGRAWVMCTVVACVSGCAHMSTQRGHLTGIEDKLGVNDFEGALVQVKTARGGQYKEKDRILYYLDAGLLSHYSAQWEESNALLADAERGIEDAYTRSVRSAAASIMLNDNALEYAGEDYEDVYLNVFKAINYLRLGEFDSAFVEIRRINDKLNLLEDRHANVATGFNTATEKGKPFTPGRAKFHNSALARYLSMLMYRAEGNRDSARIDMMKINEAWQAAPEVYDFKMPSLTTALTPSPDAYAKLNVIGFYGRSPDKLARTLYIHTRKDAVLIMTTEQKSTKKTNVTALEVIPWPLGGLLPENSIFKFQIPYMKLRGTSVARATLHLNGYPVEDLVPLERLEKVALETFKIREPLIFLKTITRTIAKSIVSTRAKSQLKKQGSGNFLTDMLVDAAVAATENADLRIAQFFPAVAGISEVDVPVGQYRATVVYYDATGTSLYQDELGVVDVTDGGLHLLQSCYLN